MFDYGIIENYLHYGQVRNLPYQRGVCIRQVSVLEMYLYQIGVCIIERCLYQRSVHDRKLSVLERCSYQRGDCIIEVCIIERCLHQSGVYVRKVFVLERCLYQRDVHTREMSPLERCLYYRAFLNLLQFYSIYFQAKPPQYDVGSIDVPIALSSGCHDPLSDPADVCWCRNSGIWSIIRNWRNLTTWILLRVWMRTLCCTQTLLNLARNILTWFKIIFKYTRRKSQFKDKEQSRANNFKTKHKKVKLYQLTFRCLQYNICREI